MDFCFCIVEPITGSHTSSGAPSDPPFCEVPSPCSSPTHMIGSIITDLKIQNQNYIPALTIKSVLRGSFAAQTPRRRHTSISPSKAAIDAPILKEDFSRSLLRFPAQWTTALLHFPMQMWLLHLLSLPLSAAPSPLFQPAAVSLSTTPHFPSSTRPRTPLLAAFLAPSLTIFPLCYLTSFAIGMPTYTSAG
jgi:hypothetical protein